MIFETHAHYDDESFDTDREELICSMPERGIGRIINVGASIETTKTTLELAAKYDFVYAAVGVHPSDISGLNGLSSLKELNLSGNQISDISSLGFLYHKSYFYILTIFLNFLNIVFL